MNDGTTYNINWRERERELFTREIYILYKVWQFLL